MVTQLSSFLKNKSILFQYIEYIMFYWNSTANFLLVISMFFNGYYPNFFVNQITKFCLNCLFQLHMLSHWHWKKCVSHSVLPWFSTLISHNVWWSLHLLMVICWPLWFFHWALVWKKRPYFFIYVCFLFKSYSDILKKNIFGFPFKLVYIHN